MKKSTKRITLSALFAALAVVFLYFSSIIPSGRIAVTAIAGLFTAAAVIESGVWSGLLCFIASALLGFFIIPDKGNVAVYILFFGYYPVVKSFIERQKSRVIEWTLKILVLNAAVSLLIIGYTTGFIAFNIETKYTYPLIYLVCNAAFVIYDLGLSKLICFYISRISYRINRK